MEEVISDFEGISFSEYFKQTWQVNGEVIW